VLGGTSNDISGYRVECAGHLLGALQHRVVARVERDDPDRCTKIGRHALQQRRPAYARRWLLRRGDRVRLQVEVTAFPIIGQEERLLGAIAMFWERQGP